MATRRERFEALAVEVAEVNRHVKANRLTLEFMIGRDEEGNVVAELDSWKLMQDDDNGCGGYFCGRHLALGTCPHTRERHV